VQGGGPEGAARRLTHQRPTTSSCTEICVALKLKAKATTSIIFNLIAQPRWKHPRSGCVEASCHERGLQN
jgi:hypothetical protein